MRILQHPLVEEIGETPDLHGDRYALHVQLKGRRTITELREVLNEELLQMAMDDLNEEECKLIVVKPEKDGIDEREECRDKITTEQIVNVLGQRNDNMFYLDTRESRLSAAACLHTHPNDACVSTLAVSGGRLPTAFVWNEEEAEDLLHEEAKTMGGEVAAAIEHTPVLSDALNALAGLYFSDGIEQQQRRRAIADLFAGVYTKLQGVHRSIPSIGTVNIFSGSVVHGAEPFTDRYTQDNAGILCTEHWRKNQC